MPVFIPKTKFREVTDPKFRNRCWEQWGPFGKIIGSALVLIGTVLSVLEIIRIIYGPTNRGITNYGPNDNNQFPERNDGLLFGVHGSNFPRRVEKFHYWPWTYAANLFGLVAICAGIAGIISAFRRSYSSLFAFLTLSVFTALLFGFLIGYYSILVNYYKKLRIAKGPNRPDTMDTTWGLIGTNLALSILGCILGMLGFLSACLGIRGCTPKGIPVSQDVDSYAQFIFQNSQQNGQTAPQGPMYNAPQGPMISAPRPLYS